MSTQKNTGATPPTPLVKKSNAIVPHNNGNATRRSKYPTNHVPSRARTRKTARWRAIFLRTLAKTPSVTMAAKAAGINRRTAYDHKELDPEFAKKWEDALDQSLDVLEHAVYQRALTEDAQLAMFLLRAHRPTTYRETQRLDVGLLGGIVFIPEKKEGAE
jgi:hypothetical protein